MNALATPPTVLVFAGNDPSGGAGLCADIQMLAHLGCHAAPIVTCITVQDTKNVLENQPLSSLSVIAQAEAVLADMHIAAFKMGLLGSVEIIIAVSQIVQRFPQIPVIFDPVLAAGGGKSLATQSLIAALCEHLLPWVTVLTPNSLEAKALSGKSTLDSAATTLLTLGCQHVCITGTHEETEVVTNILYSENFVKSWDWQRLPYSYHGSGCTFAAAVAGYMARGENVVTAIAEAQRETWRSLATGFHPGRGQALPNRLGLKPGF